MRESRWLVGTAYYCMARKKRSKRYQKALEQVDLNKGYPREEGFKLVTQFPKANFDETVDMAFHLGVDPRHSDQMVRGTVALPHGSGKPVRVVVFAKTGGGAEAAREAGADHVGFDDLIQQCSAGWTDFDVAIATPDAMVEVRKLGKILGPRGLMPNPRTGTVTEDVAKAVKEFKAGRVEFKLDKTANVHVAIGKVSFPVEQLIENGNAVVDALLKARPAAAKGHYIQSCALATTMSPPVRMDVRDLVAAL